jgi:hypothetical protein
VREGVVGDVRDSYLAGAKDGGPRVSQDFVRQDDLCRVETIQFGRQRPQIIEVGATELAGRDIQNETPTASRSPKCTATR